jgi:hypothetical protein
MGDDDDYPAPPKFEDYILLQELFWFFSSLCLAASMHVVLTTIFIQLMGPRMALYGAIGSMAKAADGMRELVDEIFLAFVIMIIFFALSTLMSFWVLMSFQSAIVSSCLFIISSTQWWRYCSRIYNQFKYDRGNSLYNFQEGSDGYSDTGSRRPSISSANDRDQVEEPKPSTFLSFWGIGKSPKPNEDTIQNGKHVRRSRRNSAEYMRDCRFSGYVSLEDVVPSTTASNFPASRQNPGLLNPATTWSRVFLYLSTSGDLYYFRSKCECPAIPINSRAIESQLYDVVTEVIPISDSLRTISAPYLQAVLDDCSIPDCELFAYELRLSRRRFDATDNHLRYRVWKFRLDTVEEMTTWAMYLNPPTIRK